MQGRRKRPGGPFAGLGHTVEGAGQQLAVYGHAATLFPAQALAEPLESKAYLQPWFGQEANLVDRYDVRLLFEDVRQFERPAGASSVPADEAELLEELQHERYTDLEEAEATATAEQQGHTLQESVTGIATQALDCSLPALCLAGAQKRYYSTCSYGSCTVC